MRTSFLFLSGIPLVLIPSVALADIGVPMIAYFWPYMFVGFIPIAIAEGLIFQRMLNIEIRTAFRVSVFVNVITTFLGIPITWILLVFLQMLTGGGSYDDTSTLIAKFLTVTWQAPWLMPLRLSDYYWLPATAMLVLLIPFFFVTWWIEAKVISKFLLPSVDEGRVRSACIWANLVSYSILALAPVSTLIVGEQLAEFLVEW